MLQLRAVKDNRPYLNLPRGDLLMTSDVMTFTDPFQALLAAYIGSALVLAVLSYVSSVLVLDGLAALGKRMDASQRKWGDDLWLKKQEETGQPKNTITSDHGGS